MAHVFLSDGGPEAYDYSNNYITFNDADPQVLSRLFKVLCSKNHSQSEIRLMVESICKSSFSENKNYNPNARSSI